MYTIPVSVIPGHKDVHYRLDNGTKIDSTDTGK